MRFSVADICFWTGDYKRTIHELITCLKIKPNEYKAYEQLGLVYANMGDYKNSLKYYRRGLKLAQKTDDVYKFRIHVARVYWRTSLFLRAQNECQDILKNIKDMKKSDIGLAYLTLGVVLLRLDKLDKAEPYLKKALKIYRVIDDKNHIAACYQDLALCYRRKFNTKACESYLKKALAIDKKIGYLGGIVIARINLGALYSDYNLVKAEEYCIAPQQPWPCI
jgi:tetratricopeptide (TPR) repeat protein